MVPPVKRNKGKEMLWRVVLVALAPVLTVALVAVLEAIGLAPAGLTERLARLLLVPLGELSRAVGISAS